MFTGIVQETGTVEKIERGAKVHCADGSRAKLRRAV